MNGIGALVEQFSLPEISRVLKRTVIIALVAGAIAIFVSGLLGHILFGFGAYLGVGLGLMNIRAITNQTAKVANSDTTRVFRAMAQMTLVRLGATTVAIVVLFIADRDLGLGAAVGLCAYYLIFVANIAATIVHNKAVP
jgi:ABC-type antimicrobial peptide transport system permease subunit